MEREVVRRIGNELEMQVEHIVKSGPRYVVLKLLSWQNSLRVLTGDGRLAEKIEGQPGQRGFAVK